MVNYGLRNRIPTEWCGRPAGKTRYFWGTFRLPTAAGTFYPDFVAELEHGRVLIVEYKGEHLVERDQQEKNIGERCEETVPLGRAEGRAWPGRASPASGKTRQSVTRVCRLR
jgi:hypothetical protein